MGAITYEEPGYTYENVAVTYEGHVSAGLLFPVVTIQLATARGANPATWTDITDYVTQYQCRWGRDDILAQVQTGDASLTLRNADGRFSPANTLSPLYPYVDDMVAVKIELTYNGLTYPRFFGYIQSITPHPADPLNLTEVLLADGFCWLDLARELTPAYTNAPTGTNIGALLDAAMWPAALRDLNVGQSTFLPAFGTDSALTQLQSLAVDNEAGLAFMGRNGDVVFQDRHYRATAPTSLVSQGTFTDTNAMLDLLAERPARDIYNRITVTYNGGSLTRNDASSEADYGPRVLSIDAAFLNALEAADRGDWTLAQKKAPHDRPQIPFWGNISAAVLVQMLERNLSDRVTITDASGYTAINADFYIEGITESVDVENEILQMRWQLSPVDVFAGLYWSLGVAGYSELGVTTGLSY